VNSYLHEANSDKDLDEEQSGHPVKGDGDRLEVANNAKPGDDSFEIGNSVGNADQLQVVNDRLHVAASGASSDHLSEGDVFSIYGMNGESAYKIAKIVKIRHNDLHIFVYDVSYPNRPSGQSLDSLILLPNWLEVQRSRDMYIPVSRKLFSLMRPMILGNRSVKDVELNGYRQWCLTEERHVLGHDICLDDEVEKNVRIYLKIFFSYSVPTIFVFSFYTVCLNAFDLLPAACLFGISFGVVMVILQWASIRRQRSDLRRISASSIQFLDIELNMPYHEAFELGVQALNTINNCTPIAVEPAGGTIEARVAKSLVDDGQEILMVFSKVNDQRTVCVVWSESPKGVTFDMGKNLGNVNAIISYLKSPQD